jgi:hypothetical protein
MMAMTPAPAAPKSSSLSSLNSLVSSSAESGRHRLEHVATSALERLHQSPYRGLRSVELDVRGNTMVLTGQVRTFFLKQMAQHLLGDYSGAWEIQNNLRVA